MFPEAEGRGKYSLPSVQYYRYSTRKGRIFILLHRLSLNSCANLLKHQSTVILTLKQCGPIQVELTYSSIIVMVILLNTKHKKKLPLTLNVMNKTVTNTLHGTNFKASNSRNRLL